MGITRAGGALGIPGLYVTDDPGGMQYHRGLMMAILHERVHIAKAVNARVAPFPACYS